jgi:hypothetical protein
MQCPFDNRLIVQLLVYCLRYELCVQIISVFIFVQLKFTDFEASLTL